MKPPNLYEIVAEALGVDAATITPETSAETCSDWDSLTNLRILVAVEERFGMRFPTVKLPILTSVAEYERELRERGIGV